MEQILVLLNPLAGTKRAVPALASILDIFCKAGFEPIVRTTQGPGDGTKLAREYAGRVGFIVCIGGDGSLNEVVSGVLHSGSHTPIGYIPAGSTNDFATSLGLSKDLLQAAKDIIWGKPIPFDVGRFGSRYFTYVASFGAFTEASYSTPQEIKNTLGHLAYVLQAAASLPTLKSVHAHINTDEGERLEGDYLFGAIGNSTSMGGVLTLEKSQVDFHDGKFELLLVKNPKDAGGLGECIRALIAQGYHSSMIEFRHIRSASISLDPATDWTLDGEFCEGSRKIELEVLPQAIEMIVNP